MPTLEITKQFTFEAAHTLPEHPGACRNLHGHSYGLAVTVGGPVGPDGMVMDFTELGATVRTLVVDVLDHTLLNDRWSNPTAEIVALAIFETLAPSLPTLRTVTLRETATSTVTVTADSGT